MDLERLQVVISAKTDQLQKSINDVVSKLKGVNKVNDDVENSFKDVGTAGENAFNKAAKAAKDYYDNIAKMAKYYAKYDVFGATDQQEPWVNKVSVMKGTLEDFRTELEANKDQFEKLFAGGEKLNTLNFGLLSQNFGNAKMNAEMLEAVIDELTQKLDDSDSVKLSSGLVELAVNAHRIRGEMEQLIEDIQLFDATEIDASEYARFAQLHEEGFDTEAAKKRVLELSEAYGSIRRQIEEAIDGMGGLTAEAEAGTSAFMSYTNAATTVALVIAKVAKVAWQVGSAIAKVTNEIGKVLWKIEPVHKALGKISESIQSLWTRIKRVLVYSTIVSFFNEVKSHIKDYLTANKELMSALGEAKGA